MTAPNRIGWLGSVLLIAIFVLLLPGTAFAMHIADGILPLPWAGLWWAVALPFLGWGLRELRMLRRATPHIKALVGLVGAAVFVISCVPIPVPTAGTSSHPCGTGLAAIFIGPGLTVVVASVALVLQALFLADGGLTSLGADLFSLGVAGAYVGFGAFWLARRLGLPATVGAFLAGILSDWATYAMTSIELASALHGSGSVASMFLAILVAFVPTQLPLGILEGLLAAGAYRFVLARRPALLHALSGKEIRR